MNAESRGFILSRKSRPILCYSAKARSSETSRAGALCVIHPVEIMSTPVDAYSAAFAGVIPPEASVTTCRTAADSF